MSISRRLFALSRRELAVLATLFLLSLPAVTPRIYSSDEIEYFSYLRSIWFDGDVSFENEYQYFYDKDVARGEGFHETFLERETEAGRRFNFGTIGCAILWSPFYGAADLVVRVMRASGSDVPADGFSQPYIAAVAYGSAFYGLLAVLISIGVARRTLSEEKDSSGIVSGVVVWLGTPLLFYMYVAPPMSHACSAFAVALFVALWLHVRRTWSLRQVVALGFAAALMAMVREQDVFFAVGPALDFLLSQIERRHDVRRIIGTAAAGCAAFVVGFLPQLIAYERLNGHMWPSRVVARKMTWSAPHAAGVLFSPSHGFFFWTPLALVAIIGLVAMAARYPGDRRRVAAIALLMIGLQVYVGGSVESWTVAGAFGQRRFVALTVLLALGLAGLQALIRGRTARVLLAMVAVLCVWWNLALIALFGTGLMDRQRIELARNAYDAFVTIPRMAPSLAYRYLIDRDSYYRRSAEPRTP